MTLLNPVWLLLMPFVLLPLVIHLWNQSRHKVVDWGAMRFLIAAQHIRGGRQRLRHWLIMLSRMLAIAALIFLLARPLSSGLFGAIAGGQAQTVLVVLDRSASMQQQSSLGGLSKLESGLQTIVSTLEASNKNSRIYLLEDTTVGSQKGENAFGNVIELQKPMDLLDLAGAAPTEAQANLPSMLEAVLDFVRNNQTGRTDVWICSDGSESDWQATSSQWPSLEKQFAELKGVRLQYLHLPDPCLENLSVTVERCQQLGNSDAPELSIDLSIQSAAKEFLTQEVPLTVMVGNARHAVRVTLQGGRAELNDYRIPLAAKTERGWGYVELPNDCQPADNRYYFTFAPATARQTLIVTEQPPVVRSLELTAKVPVQEDGQSNVTVVSTDRVDSLDLSIFHLIVWQGRLPTGSLAQKVEAYAQSRGVLILLPPATPDETEFMGLSWGAWKSWDEGQRLASWENERELLRRSSDGTRLPLDQLAVYQACRLKGAEQALAVLADGQPLITKNAAAGGGVVALATWPLGTHSTLDKDLIGLYALVQRSLELGFQRRAGNHAFSAGSEGAQAAAALRVITSNPRSAESFTPPPSLRPLLAGVYQGEQTLLAINRPRDEDQSLPLSTASIKQLFGKLDFQLIEGRGSNTASLASEVWKSFALVTLVALLGEAVLTLPPKRSARPVSPAGIARVAA